VSAKFTSVARVSFQIKTTEAMHYRATCCSTIWKSAKIGHGHPGSRAQIEPGAPTADAKTAPLAGPPPRQRRQGLCLFRTWATSTRAALPIHAAMCAKHSSPISTATHPFSNPRDTSKLEGSARLRVQEIWRFACAGYLLLACVGRELLHLPAQKLGFELEHKAETFAKRRLRNVVRCRADSRPEALTLKALPAVSDIASGATSECERTSLEAVFRFLVTGASLRKQFDC